MFQKCHCNYKIEIEVNTSWENLSAFDLSFCPKCGQLMHWYNPSWDRKILKKKKYQFIFTTRKI